MITNQDLHQLFLSPFFYCVFFLAADYDNYADGAAMIMKAHVAPSPRVFLRFLKLF
jgi:hypothetical protein